MNVQAIESTQVLQVEPIPAALGAQVLGVDLSRPLVEGQLRAIHQAFLEHLVLVFPGQTLTAAEQVAFCRRFGRIQYQVMDHLHAEGVPEIYLLSNVDDAGNTTGRHTDEASLVWHTDAAWKEEPAMATFLYAIEVPEAGGDTWFANMYAGYESLDRDLQRTLAGMTVASDLAFARHKWHMSEEQIAKVSNPAEHPVVRTHPESGRRCIYLGEHASQISGLSYDEGHRLLEEVNAAVTQPEFVYRDHWRAKDLVMWTTAAFCTRSPSLTRAMNAG